MKAANSRRAMNRLVALASAAIVLACSAAWAQQPGDLDIRRQATQGELQQISREISLSAEKREAIESEIESLKKDQRSLTAAMIQAAKTERKLSVEAEGIGQKVDALKLQEADLKGSLSERRSLLAEVLAALQRMGLNPPPAILVRPEDALSSVRSAILLGAVVPEMRAETEMLVADLAELSRLSTSIDDERRSLVATVEAQAAEKERLALLIGEKAELQRRSEEVMAAEQARATELASRATNLRDLIASLETEIESVRLAEKHARDAAEAERLAALESERQVPAETSRMAEPVPFDRMVGKAIVPVAGQVSTRFGQPDETGMRLMGDMVTTQSGAIVSAPADGSVLYAGPFRSYGQLLILNAGGGYHIVLAGMGRINVSLGQTVLAGEPVGAMGEARLASAASVGNETTGAQLYVELRKDGTPVDPAPWWAESYSGRTRNGS